MDSENILKGERQDLLRDCMGDERKQGLKASCGVQEAQSQRLHGLPEMAQPPLGAGARGGVRRWEEAQRSQTHSGSSLSLWNCA